MRAEALPWSVGGRRGSRTILSPAAVSTLAGAVAAIAAAWTLWADVPPERWWAVLSAPDAADPAQLVAHYATLPRLAMALLCGAGLALAGTLLQAALSNPLAVPSTLGVSAGAQLAMVAATVAGPGLLDVPGRETVAVVGAAGVGGFVLLVATRRGFAPATVVLVGLTAGLFAGALGAVLKLFDAENVGAVFVWGGGSLAQTGWSSVATLLPRLAASALVAALVARPLAKLGLDDAGARSLGVSPSAVRLAVMALAVLIAGFITAAVGIVGFVELAGPWLAGFAGARRLAARLVHGALIGGFLLVAIDALVAAASRATGLFLPTGAVAAILAAPLVLLAATRLPAAPLAPAAVPELRDSSAGVWTPRRLLPALLAALGVAILAALFLGRTGQGWSIGEAASATLAWRAPRTLACLGAGALFGAAGSLLQRLTANPMVSPETLGIGAGSAVGLVAATWLASAPSATVMAISGFGGAVLVIVLLLGSAARSGFSPDRLLVTGVALASLLQAVLAVVLAVGDARAVHLLVVMSGLTYGTALGSAVAAVVAAVLLLPVALLFSRALDILPLGEPAARSLGVSVGLVRGALALVAVFMTATAVGMAGPLTFVGLVAPHLATRLGFRRSTGQVAAAALLGALVMVLADTLARTVVAPFEIPTGLVASLIGVPYLLVLLCRTSE